MTAATAKSSADSAEATTPVAAGRLDEPVADDARRIGVAWRELRRGASMQTLRELIHGPGTGALELAQADALELLVQQGPLRMRELADGLRVDASTATRTVDRLVRAGLAERRSGGDDARVVVVRPTRLGRARHARSAARARALLTDVLAEFDDHERHQLAELMERLVRSVDVVVTRTT